MLRVLWFIVVPALLAAVVLRHFVPTVVETKGTWAETLARVAEEHVLWIGAGLFVAFSVLIRYWVLRLPLFRRPPQADARRTFVRLAASVAVAAAGALLVRSTIVESCRVLSASMLPTLEPGDRILVDKLAYGFRLPGLERRFGAQMPRRGDIVVFRNPVAGAEPERLVKRVIGFPGDRVTMDGNFPLINGWRVPACDAARYLYISHKAAAHARLFVEFLEDRAYLSLYGLGTKPFTANYEVRPDEVFVLGDDRNNSSDSRAWNGGKGGGLALSAIAGRASRHLTHERRDARTDFGSLLRPFDLRPHLDEMDTRPLEQGIAECLGQRPADTYPPAPPANAGGVASGG